MLLRQNNLFKLILLISITSCSLFTKKDTEVFDYKQLAIQNYNQDYVEHLSSLGLIYERQADVRLFKLNSNSIKYINAVLEKILQNNELFFNREDKFQVKIIKSKEVFHFSLPNKNIYLSSELIKKYIKNERLLLCVLVFEMIRSEKNIYRRVGVFPTGVMNTARMLSLVKIGTKSRVELHKWAYYLLKRSGVDTDLYLSWLQTLNRNSLDFSLMLEEKNSISFEESSFKNFLIANVKQNIKQVRHERSPKQFYKFLYNVNKL